MQAETLDAPVHHLDHLPPGLRMVRATRHLESELKRRGFSSYFSVFGAAVALKAMQGYRMIGAECHADLVEAALAIYLCSGSRRDSFHVLEDAFRDLESPRSLKLDYIRENPAEFARAI